MDNPSSADEEINDSIRDNSKIRRENARLIQVNQELQRQLEVLQKQFKQAVNISNTIDGVFAEKSAMSSQIIQLQTERDDLNRRLTISLQANKELQDRLDGMHGSPSEPLKIIAKRHEQKIQDLQQRLNSTERDLQQEIIQKKQAQSDLDRIYKEATNYFHAPIISADGLIRQLLIPVIKDQPQPVPNDGKIRKLTHKILSLKEQNRLLSSQLATEKYEKQSLVQSNTNLSDKINLLSSQIEDLTRSNDRLSAKNQQLLKSQSTIPMPTTSSEEGIRLAHELSVTSSELSAAKSSIEHLKQQNDKLKLRFKSSEEQISTLTLQLKDSEMKREQLKLKCRRLATRIKDIESQEPAPPKVIEKVVPTIDESELNRLREGHKYEITRIQEEYKRREADLRQQLQESRNEQISFQKRLEQALQPIDTSSLLPLACWSCHDFPKELNDLVADIARNPTMRAPTKLRHVLACIAKWYTSRSDRIDTELKEKKTQLNESEASVTRLIEYLKKLFPEVDANLEQILIDPHVRDILTDHVIRLRQQIKDSLEAKQRSDDNAVNIIIAAGCTDIEEVKDVIYKMKSERQILERKLQKSRKRFEKVIVAMQKQESSMKEINDLCESKADEINSLHAQIADLQKQLQQAAVESEQQVKEHQNEIQCIINENKEQVMDLQKRIDELARQLADYEKEIALLSEQKKQLNSIVQQLNTQNNQLKEQICETENKYKEKVRSEREASQTRYDQVIEQMKKQNEEARSTITELKAELERIGSKNEELQIKVSEQTIMLQKMETKASAVESERERERKSIDSQWRAKMMAFESETRAKIDEGNAIKDAVRKIGAFVMEDDPLRIVDAVRKILQK